jgi:hypothetical protein
MMHSISHAYLVLCQSANYRMQATPINIVPLHQRARGAPDAGR